MKKSKCVRIHSMRVSLYVIWILSANFVSSAWMPWQEEDFTANPQLEDEYIYEYGNADADVETNPRFVDADEDVDESDYQKWEAVRNLYEARTVGKLIKLCMIAHGLAGRGNVSINAIKLNARKLKFKNVYYESRLVDVMTYGVKNETDITSDYWDVVVGPENYITEGLRPDCVCYLTLLSSLKMEFGLYEHVCGLNVTGITDVKSTRRHKPTTSTTTKRAKGGTKKCTKEATTKKSTVSKKSTQTPKTSTATVTKKTTKGAKKKLVSDT